MTYIRFPTLTGVSATGVQNPELRVSRLCKRKPDKLAGQETTTLPPAAAAIDSRGGDELELTVTVNVRLTLFWPPLSVPPSSKTVTVITAVPEEAGVGARVNLPMLLGLL